MRAVLVVGLIVLLCPAVASAQTSAAPAQPTKPAAPASTSANAAPRRGGDITRDEYIERAKQAAERRFDAMDADHDGVLTADERRAYRAGHSRRQREPAAPQPSKPQ
jgi:hypothetical protein